MADHWHVPWSNKFIPEVSPFQPARRSKMAMDDQTILVLQAQQGIKTISVKFFGIRADLTEGGIIGSEYTYKCDFDCDVGDLVMVEARDWYQVCEVTQVHDTPDYSDDRKLRWALANVTDAKKYSQDLRHAENEARRKLVQSRARKQANEVLAAAGIEDAEAFMALPRVEEATVIEEIPATDHGPVPPAPPAQPIATQPPANPWEET